MAFSRTAQCRESTGIVISEILYLPNSYFLLTPGVGKKSWAFTIQFSPQCCGGGKFVVPANPRECGALDQMSGALDISVKQLFVDIFLRQWF